jgi:lactoylglutathione lyase
MMNSKSPPLLKSVDCIRLHVSGIEAGLHYYRDQLGHELAWRTENAAGLRMPGTNTEIVLQTMEKLQEVDYLVESVDEASIRIKDAGGMIVEPPFDIQIGRCAVVQDPWGNKFVILDISKGLLATYNMGNVIGNLPPQK